MLDWPSTDYGWDDNGQKLIIQVAVVPDEIGLEGLIHMPVNKILRYCCPD
jgi:hypothetical protein